MDEPKFHTIEWWSWWIKQKRPLLTECAQHPLIAAELCSKKNACRRTYNCIHCNSLCCSKCCSGFLILKSDEKRSDVYVPRRWICYDCYDSWHLATYGFLPKNQSFLSKHKPHFMNIIDDEINIIGSLDEAEKKRVKEFWKTYGKWLNASSKQ
jgi:hypothetical protein